MCTVWGSANCLISARILSLTVFGYSRPERATRLAAISGRRTLPNPGWGEEEKSSPNEEKEALDAAEWRPADERETGRKAEGLGSEARRMPGGGEDAVAAGGAVVGLELGRGEGLVRGLGGV